jgi:endonuclease YncB( thermonuclease family)
MFWGSQNFFNVSSRRFEVLAFLREKKENGKPVFKNVDVKERYIFTYKAYVESVWDGDTIWVVLDVGFGLFLRQKIRFGGLDAPEKETAEGIKARHFVEDALKGLPFVVLKCHGRDKWDRYLMDVFYLRGENDSQNVLEKGNFLNQELFDAWLVYPYNEENGDQ